MNAHQRRKERRAFIRDLTARGVKFSKWSSLSALRHVHQRSGKR